MNGRCRFLAVVGVVMLAGCGAVGPGLTDYDAPDFGCSADFPYNGGNGCCYAFQSDGNYPSCGGESDFPEVTSRIRISCASWLETDAQIAGVMSVFESDRSAGFTEQQAHQSVVLIALDWFGDDPQSASAYTTCMTAIIDDVWP